MTTATHRHHTEWAEAQNTLAGEGRSMMDDGEHLERLAARQGGEDEPDLFARLERLALMAEIANHHIDDMRVMPAAGVADTLREAMDWIQDLQGEQKRGSGAAVRTAIADEITQVLDENLDSPTAVAEAIMAGRIPHVKVEM